MLQNLLLGRPAYDITRKINPKSQGVTGISEAEEEKWRGTEKKNATSNLNTVVINHNAGRNINANRILDIFRNCNAIRYYRVVWNVHQCVCVCPLAHEKREI